MSRIDYDKVITERKLPDELSLIELGVIASMLGVDTDSIRGKHFQAMFVELRKAVEGKLKSK